MARLEDRAPNPPVVFEGRVSELAALAQDSRVAVVWGPGGVGKSALVAQFLATSEDPSAAAAVWVRANHDRRAQPGNALLAALGHSLGLPPLSDAAELLRALVDHLDSERTWLVIDDLHRASQTSSVQLLESLARYLRRARVIATSRMAPVEIEGVARIAVGALDDGALVEIASRLRPDATERELFDLVAASRGSPWRLRGLVAGQAIDDKNDLRSTVLGDPFLRALCTLDQALPGSVLKECGVQIAEGEALDALVERGIVDRSFAGLRMHDVALGLIGHRAAVGIDDRSLAEALANHENTSAAFTGCCILLRNGWIESVARVIEERFESLVSDGFGEDLVFALRGQTSEPIASLRVRLAGAVGAVWLLDSIAEPPSGGNAVTIAWASLLRRRGEFAAALELLETISASELDPELAFEVGMDRARCLYNLERLAEAVSVQRELEPATRDQAAQLYTALAMDAALLGDWRLATASVDHAELALVAAELGYSDWRYLPHSYLYLGRLSEARRVLDERCPRPRTSAERVMWLQARALTAMPDDLNLALQHLRDIDSISKEAAIAAFVFSCRMRARILSGDLDGAGVELDRALGENQEHLATQRSGLLTSRVELATCRGETLPVLECGSDLELDLRVAHHRVTWDRLEKGDRSAIALGSLAPPPHCFASALTLALDDLVNGLQERAVARLQETLTAAVDAGYLIEAGRALVLLCDGLLLLRRNQELATRALQLARLADDTGSRRFVELARWNQCVNSSSPDWLGLEGLAASTASPTAARRARWLLGHDPSLSGIETAIATTILGPLRAHIVQHSASPDEAWGVDERSQSFWTSERVRHLGDGLHMRLLLCLVRGKTLDKATLIRDVWSETDYHPLRHDPKLKNAISKLRALVEDDGKNPQRIVTTADGYAIAPSHLVRLAPLSVGND